MSPINLSPDDIVKWAGNPIAVIDCFGILSDDKIRRYFELGCEVKALGRGHIQRIKRKSGKRINSRQSGGRANITLRKNRGGTAPLLYSSSLWMLKPQVEFPADPGIGGSIFDLRRQQRLPGPVGYPHPLCYAHVKQNGCEAARLKFFNPAFFATRPISTKLL